MLIIAMPSWVNYIDFISTGLFPCNANEYNANV